jgi:hypothetical protein
VVLSRRRLGRPGHRPARDFTADVEQSAERGD